VRADKVNEALIGKYLYDPNMPDPELMIRTSGENRLSNFLMWQLAYTEMIFTEVLWPDFTREHIYGAVQEYQRRNRRFGGV
jgi:undecaprenyl diphosphate synthase